MLLGKFMHIKIGKSKDYSMFLTAMENPNNEMKVIDISYENLSR